MPHSRRGVLEEAADGVEGHVAQSGIPAAGEQRLAALPDRDVGVHAGAVVAEERLGHGGDRLVVLLGHVLDDVLVEHHLVGHVHQLVELHVDFRLAGRAHFVVLGLDADADSISVCIISLRMFIIWSAGGTGK